MLPTDVRQPLPSLVGRLVHAIEHELPPGDVAELRRLQPQDPSCPAFWKLSASLLDAELGAPGVQRERLERGWAAVLAGLARLTGQHRPDVALGRALAEAGFSELRLMRLLRAHDAALLDAARTMAAYLASKAQVANLTDFARLILTDGGPDEERVRRDIARSYYRTVTHL